MNGGWWRLLGATIVMMGVGATACRSEDGDSATATSLGEATGTPGSTSDAGTSDAGTTALVDTSSSSGAAPECIVDADCPDSELGALCRMDVCLPPPACAFNGDSASCMAADCIWDLSCVPEGKCCGDITEPECGCT